MKSGLTNRRRFLKSAATGLFLPALPQIIRAQAFSFRDLPMMQPRGGISTPPAVLDWVTRVQTNGGPKPIDSTIAAATTRYNCLVSAGLDGLILADGLFACGPTDSQAAAVTPFFKTKGIDPWTVNHIIVNANGLSGDLTSGQYLNTGCVLSSTFSSVNDLGITLYIYSSSNSGNEFTSGAADAAFANSVAIFDANTSHIYAEAGDNSNIIDITPSTGFNGFLSINRTSSSSMVLYKANSSTPHAVFASISGSLGGALPGAAFYVFNINVNGSTGGPYSGCVISYAAVHRSMTQTQNAAFYSCTQAFLQTMGAGWV